jgi:hypothetical protein
VQTQCASCEKLIAYLYIMQNKFLLQMLTCEFTMTTRKRKQHYTCGVQPDPKKLRNALLRSNEDKSNITGTVRPFGQVIKKKVHCTCDKSSGVSTFITLLCICIVHASGPRLFATASLHWRTVHVRSYDLRSENWLSCFGQSYIYNN